MMFTIPEVFVDYPNPISVAHVPIFNSLSVMLSQLWFMFVNCLLRIPLHHRSFNTLPRQYSYAPWSLSLFIISIYLLYTDKSHEDMFVND